MFYILQSKLVHTDSCVMQIEQLYILILSILIDANTTTKKEKEIKYYRILITF